VVLSALRTAPPRTDQQPALPSGPSPVGSHPVSRGGRAPFDRGDPLRAVMPKFLSATLNFSSGRRWDHDPKLAELGWEPPVKIRKRNYRRRQSVIRVTLNSRATWGSGNAPVSERGRATPKGDVLTQPNAAMTHVGAARQPEKRRCCCGCNKMADTHPTPRRHGDVLGEDKLASIRVRLPRLEGPAKGSPRPFCRRNETQHTVLKRACWSGVTIECLAARSDGAKD
jgi:hypothetical protein